MDITAHVLNEQTWVLPVWLATCHHGTRVKRTEFGITRLAEDIVHGHHGTCVKRAECRIPSVADDIYFMDITAHV